MLFLTAITVSAQTINPETECTASNNSPFCHVFQTQCKTRDCAQLGYYLCREKGTCATCDTCSNPFLDTVPNIRNATQFVTSICTEMPNMENCNQCPPPVNGISNCNVLKAYIDLCDEMPKMGQCKQYESYCAIVGCKGFQATGTNAPKPTTSTKSSGTQVVASLMSLILMLL
jgi:hypothetical protein